MKLYKLSLLLLIGPILLPIIINGYIAPSPTPTATPFIEAFRRDASAPEYYPFTLHNAEPQTVMLTLQQIAAGATTDSEIISRVVSYYDANEDRLEALWQEPNETRLKSFFAMYVIHISHPYGTAPYPNTSFVNYLSQPFAHCGPQSYFQTRILAGLGVTDFRRVGISSGNHGWTEVRIGGHWEIFDADSNVWIDKSGFELITGIERSYRQFYTPFMDARKPEFRQVVAGHYEALQYTPAALRQLMPGMGVYLWDAGYMQQTGCGLVMLP